MFGRWHHLCFTYDHQKPRISTYVDGRLNNHQDYEIDKPVSGYGARLGQGVEPTRSLSGDLTQVDRGARFIFEEGNIKANRFVDVSEEI